jgi:hypothetical protein
MLGARHCALVGLLLRAPALRRTGTGRPHRFFGSDGVLWPQQRVASEAAMADFGQRHGQRPCHVAASSAHRQAAPVETRRKRSAG